MWRNTMCSPVIGLEIACPGAAIVARRSGPRGRRAGVLHRRQLPLHLLAQRLEAWRQRQALAEVFERLVDGESGADRGNLEQHPAGLAEVDRAEVEAIDDRGDPRPGG